MDPLYLVKTAVSKSFMPRVLEPRSRTRVLPDLTDRPGSNRELLNKDQEENSLNPRESAKSVSSAFYCPFTRPWSSAHFRTQASSLSRIRQARILRALTVIPSPAAMARRLSILTRCSPV